MAGNGGSGMRKRLIVAGVIILAVGVVALLAVPPLLAAAETEPAATDAPPPDASPTPVISATPVPESRPAPITEALTPEQEAEIEARQGPIGTAIEQIRTTFPDDYAYGYIADEGFGMSFKADAPPVALAILDAVGDPYELHENVGFTELDIQPQIRRVTELVQKAVGDQSFITGANVFTVTVEVEIYPDSGTKTDHTVLEGAALQQLIDDIRPELYPGFDVTITSVPGAGIGW
ncbi:MAG: hypothetical protein JWP54_1972 [Cryobacterium sp.]|nr:hypothetical protein [Cryobacterium sp.]